MMKSPGAGHNSRAADVRRTAEEIFAKARAEWIRPDTSLTQRWQVELLCSNLPANAKLFGIVAKMHGDSDTGENIYPALDRMQALTSLSRPTTIKAKNALMKAGFLKLKDESKKSKGRVSDVFKLSFPNEGERANGKNSLPLNDAQRSKSFTVKAVYGNATVKNEGSNGKAALPDLVLPCVVEETKNTHTAREGCNGFSLQTEGEERGLQKEQASEPELFGPGEVPTPIGPLPSKEHLQRWGEITGHWGRSPAEELPQRDKPDFKVGQWLKSDVKALGFGMGYSREIIEAALELTLGAMEAVNSDEPVKGSVKGAKPAKNYFAKMFGGELRRLRNEEHDDQVRAKTVEAEAEIKVNGARRADDMKLGALNTRLEAGNQTAVKRIEAGEKVNGQARQAAPSANIRTIIDEEGRRLYAAEYKVIALISLFGEQTWKLSRKLYADGATFEDIDEAFCKETGKSRDRTESREEVCESVRRTVKKVLDKRRDEALRAKFGGEFQQFAEGHMQHRDFINDWVCISRETVTEILAKCPDVKPEGGVWRCYPHGHKWGAEDLLADKFRGIVRDKFFSHDDYGTGLQERVERELEGQMLEEQAYGAQERESHEREEEERRKEQEELAKERAEWEATRPEREATWAAEEAKRAAEEAQKQAALEADAQSLVWDGQSLSLTETGEQRLPAIDKSRLKDVLNTFSKQIVNPLARRAGPLELTERAQLWRDIKLRVQLLHDSGFTEAAAAA